MPGELRGNTTEKLDQEQINARRQNPQFPSQRRDSLSEWYDIVSVEPFASGPIVGVRVIADEKARPETRVLRVELTNPKVGVRVTCSALTARFPALQAEFEAVARGITLSE